MELNTWSSSESQVMGVASNLKGTLSTEMHGVFHEPLQGQEWYRPALVVTRCPSGKWAAIYSSDDTFEPPASHVVVDGLGIDPPGLEPWCIHHEAWRDGIQERFQSGRSLMVHNHQIGTI